MKRICLRLVIILTVFNFSGVPFTFCLGDTFTIHD